MIITKTIVKQQNDMRILSVFILVCPHCGKPLTMNLRADDTFVEDEGWENSIFLHKWRYRGSAVRDGGMKRRCIIKVVEGVIATCSKT